MNKILFLTATAFFILSLIPMSCTVTGKDTIVDDSYMEEEEEGIRSQDINTSLAAALRKNTNLQVMGIEPNIDIVIRGMNTIIGDPRPLYVVDGIRMGRNYTLAANAVNIRQVKSIKVIKSLSQLSLYGEDGKNGVIEIRHHKEEKKKKT